MPDRDERGRFLPGASGNPGGRPKGRGLTSRLRSRLETEKDGQEIADRIVDALVDAALDRDTAAAKLLWSYAEGPPGRSEEEGGNARDGVLIVNSEQEAHAVERSGFIGTLIIDDI